MPGSERQEQRLEQGQVSAKWLDRACGTISRFKAAHPNIRVSEMTPAKVQAWLDKPSANYERTELGLLKQILTWAFKKAKSIHENPLENLDLPRMTSRTVTITAADHEKAMRGAKHIRPLLEVAYLTGCRPGELRQLKWDQLADDFSEATLIVHKTAKKTGKVRRLIFPVQAQEILRKQKQTSAYVFTDSRGFAWTSNAVVQVVRKVAKDTGVQLVAGVYRHTFATNALDKGVPIATVAQLLGHSSTAMVSRVYGHLAERVDHLKSAAEIVASSPSSESVRERKSASAKRSAERKRKPK